MLSPGLHHQGLATSAALQEYLLTLPPGGLVIVPQMRLAHQVWRRQRLAARAQQIPAWEPLAMTTLTGWWRQLWRQAWLPSQPASPWQRLLLWLEVLEAFPYQGKSLAELPWAVLVDEAYDLVERYQLPEPGPEALARPLLAWRQRVFHAFRDLLVAKGWQTGAQVPRLLQAALAADQLALPAYLVVVGLETPAPVEEAWLRAVARLRPVLRIHLMGPSGSAGQREAKALPDRRQEVEWVAARLLELAQTHPLHRLAITAVNLEDYLPLLRRLFQELLGPAATVVGGHYNFSLGPTLADAPLYQAALQPLKFLVGGEQRQDLLAWLQSPFYGAWQGQQKRVLLTDQLWRQENVGYGWPALRQRLQATAPPEAADDLLVRLEQARELLPVEPVPLAVWQDRLQKLWSLLQFPIIQGKLEAEAWRFVQGLLSDLAVAGGKRLWSAATLLEWLGWGAARQDLPGEGTSEAGIQVQGFLELRGLDYDVIFCLGLNLGQFPPPPRPLPFLTPQERQAVLGGTHSSQHQFAEIAFRYLQAAAPQLILTRPLVYQDEDQIASQLVAAIVQEDRISFTALSHLHPGWLRSPAVRAALVHPVADPKPVVDECVPLQLPDQLSLTAVERALACPCQFFFTDLLGLEPLPEVAVGLTPLLRGEVLHRVAYQFTKRFGGFLAQRGHWHDDLARQLLQEVVAEVADQDAVDLHWQAELSRWLEENLGLLPRWLALEKARYQEGWRWLRQEQSFGGLHLPGWPTALQGRLDRIDQHPEQGLMIWDYKTGELLSKSALLSQRRHFQLVGYLAAVQSRLVKVPKQQAVRAGLIGLKSIRNKHLKHEDFKLSPEDWQDIMQQKLANLQELGQRVGEGRIGPDPEPAPPPLAGSVCQYCQFTLLCGYTAQSGEEAAS